MKYLDRDDWPERMAEVLDEHFGMALEMFDIDYDDAAGLLGEHWMMTLWGCAFEDLLTRFFGKNRLNIVDVFLKRRGWKEKVQTKTYMKALRDSTMSLYELSDVTAGKSMLMRDLIRGGEPVLVSEGGATRTLKQWDRLAARVLAMGNKNIIAGGALLFTAPAADTVMAAIDEAIGEGPAGTLMIDNDALRTAAPMFSNAWLVDKLGDATGKTRRTLQNSEGEDLLFHTVQFPIAAKVRQRDLGAKLDEIETMRRESRNFWNWLGGMAPDQLAPATTPNALAWSVTMDDGHIVLGNVEIKGRFLRLLVNAPRRAAAGQALLQATLGAMIGAPVTEIQTVDEMLAQQKEEPEDAIPLEIAAATAHKLLDKHYLATLDEPVNVLGEISPRAAIRTPKGREKVTAWLKYLENQSANHADPNDPLATYDFGWMWRELKIEDMRK